MTDHRAHVQRWLLTSVIALAACSEPETNKTAGTVASADAPASQPSSRDEGCALLTKSEAQSALGSPIEDFNDGSPSPMGTMLRKECFYKSEDGSRVTLTVDTYESPQVATEKYQRLRRMYRGAKDVPNLGEAAFADRGALVVRRGGTHLMVQLKPEGSMKITDYSDENQMNAILDVERQIASSALARLPATGVQVATTPLSAKSACSILPKADVETILGGSLTHAVPADSPTETSCRYTGAGGKYAHVTIEWQGGETGMAGARMAGALMGQGKGANNPVKTVDDLGDEAVMLPGGILNVRKGAALVSVDLRWQQAGESKAIEIAEMVLARM